MSGVKQHYIPQLLLRRFGVKHAKRDKTQVCVYPKNGAPFVAATDGVAAQRFFYSELAPGQETLDDRITNHEATVTADLGLIDTAAPDAVPADAAARVIAHLTVRSSHVRETFAKAGALMTDEGLELFKDPTWISRAIGLDQSELSPRLKEMVRAELSAVPGGEALLTLPGMETFLHNQLKRHFAESQSELASNIAQLQVRFSQELPAIVKSAHTRALNKSLIPDVRFQQLQRLTWSVQPASSFQAILPDCVALAKIEATPDLIPASLVSRSNALQAVFLPLDPNRFLIGSSGSKVEIPENWNSAAACASEDFFVARTREAEFARLTPDIGTSVRLYLAQELSPIFSEDPAGLLDRSG